MLVLHAVVFGALIKQALASSSQSTTTPSSDGRTQPTTKKLAMKDLKVILKKDRGGFITESFLDACYLNNYFAIFLEHTLLKNGERDCYYCICSEKDSAFCYVRMPERCHDMAIYYPALFSSRHGAMPGRQRYKRMIGEEQPLPKTLIMRRAPTPLSSCSPLTSKPYSIGYPPDDWCKGSVLCTCRGTRKFECNKISYCDKKDVVPALETLLSNDTSLPMVI